MEFSESRSFRLPELDIKGIVTEAWLRIQRPVSLEDETTRQFRTLKRWRIAEEIGAAGSLGTVIAGFLFGNSEISFIGAAGLAAVGLSRDDTNSQINLHLNRSTPIKRLK
jgi:hypothetical protein